MLLLSIMGEASFQILINHLKVFECVILDEKANTKAILY